MKFRFLIPLTLTLALTSSVFAQTATDSSSQLRDSVKQKVAEELAQIKQAVSKKAFLGTISSKVDATITLNNYKNLTRNIIVGTDTAIKLINGKDGTLADLKTGDYILVLGDVDSAGTMTAKRILVVTQPPADKRLVIYGTITKTTTSSITIDSVKNETSTIKMTSATKYTGKTNLNTLHVGDKIVVVTSNNTALILHVMIPASPASSPTSTP